MNAQRNAQRNAESGPRHPLSAKRQIQAELAGAGLAPLARLGQCFLVAPHVVERIRGALEGRPDDLLIEIGPGPGTITRLLADDAGRVVAVEIDPGLAALAGKRTAGLTHVAVLLGDALDTPLADLVKAGLGLVAPEPARRVKVFSNLPYYITTPLLFKVMEEAAGLTATGLPPVDRAVLMVQREVGERFLARPGTKDYGILTVAVGYYSVATEVARVSRHSFWPSPEVDSVIVRLDFAAVPARPVAPADFFPVLRAAFGQRRKKLVNCLAAAPSLGLDRAAAEAAATAAGVDPGRRGETLDFEEFTHLAAAVRTVRMNSR
jgi:16S rRNA (adenine1518-N6/adenine1519-N6)-dimethyltransferase